jgi:SNF2 family DNA or RNA helicase
MNIIIQSNIKTLVQLKVILNHLTDFELGDASVTPYYSSIGSHIRHILNFYDCIFNLNSKNEVDLVARDRNKEVETMCKIARFYLNTIIEKLNSFEYNMNDSVIVFDDLGLGKTAMTYTYGALFSQANSHTIHHYAIINYILDGLEISIDDANFGYNPTTPKKANLN